MIDEEALSDTGAGVDVDPRGRMGHLGKDARQKRHFKLAEFVGDAVMGHRQNRGVTKDGFTKACRCRIALIGGPHVRGEKPPQNGQPFNEAHSLFIGKLLALRTRAAFLGIPCM